jgi:CTD small phosphatase-like protein 2
MDNVFVKDLSRLGRDISKVIIVDNMPYNFWLQKENGIFIKNFYGENSKDNALIDLIPILKSIVNNDDNDVRIKLKKYENEIFIK